MQKRTRFMAAREVEDTPRRGHPNYWTTDNLEAGRFQANETARLWGVRGYT